VVQSVRGLHEDHHNRTRETKREAVHPGDENDCYGRPRIPCRRHDRRSATAKVVNGAEGSPGTRTRDSFKPIFESTEALGEGERTPFTGFRKTGRGKKLPIRIGSPIIMLRCLARLCPVIETSVSLLTPGPLSSQVLKRPGINCGSIPA